MRQTRLLAILLALLIVGSDASSAQVRINEVGYSGVDFMGSAKWVELHNTGTSTVDVSTYWICKYPNYEQIQNLTVLSGTTMLQPGDYVVLAFDALGIGDGEVGLYSTNTFSDANAMLDYMQYGSAGHQREPVAVAAGEWDAGTFVMAASDGESLAFVGDGGTHAESWASAIATAGTANPMNPDLASEALVDRFAEGTGTLFVRDDVNGLPEPGEPVDFDQAPFITRGLGPDGRSVRYYNFDVMPQETAPIFALFREGESSPVEGQLNIVDVIPGDAGYSDFWHVHKVTVPADYVANTVTSVSAVMAAGYPIERTTLVVNCPVVPDGSTATLRYTEANDTGLVRGWYQGQVVYYFDFSERTLMVELPPAGHPDAPVSPIYVSFNINPGQMGGGPPSGFVTEPGSDQTHNVVATIPEDTDYSPLWVVNAYDNAEFDAVHDLASAEGATILAEGVALVNCPIVSREGGTAVDPLPGEVPEAFSLLGNYPNPFNPQTTIGYSLNASGPVRLSVFDIMGRRIVDLIDATVVAGVYEITWDGRDARGRPVASGVYLYRLAMNGVISRTRSMTLIK